MKNRYLSNFSNVGVKWLKVKHKIILSNLLPVTVNLFCAVYFLGRYSKETIHVGNQRVLLFCANWFSFRSLSYLCFFLFSLLNHSGRLCYKAQVIHSLDIIMSACLITNEKDQLQAASHLIGTNQLPLPDNVGRYCYSVKSINLCFTMNLSLLKVDVKKGQSIFQDTPSSTFSPPPRNEYMSEF